MKPKIDRKYADIIQIGYGVSQFANNGRITIEHHKRTENGYKRGYFVNYKIGYNTYEVSEESLLDALNELYAKVQENE